MAYPIKGHRKGAYWLTYFRLESTKLSELKRQCGINEAVVRTLFLKVDPRISEVLVSHALAGTAGRRPQVETVEVGIAEGEGVDALAEL